MGFGLPAAIGAQMACPAATVFAIVGDGGFQMALPELATLANQGLPVKLVICNNGYLGMVRQWQDLFYNNRLCAVQIEAFPNIELLAAAYGIKGRIVRTPAELGPALQEALAEPGPYVLDVRVAPYENVYPMVPAGAAINEMLLEAPKPVPVETK
jgi:acetolactate synthase-1/2/3 large subunit